MLQRKQSLLLLFVLVALGYSSSLLFPPPFPAKSQPATLSAPRPEPLANHQGRNLALPPHAMASLLTAPPPGSSVFQANLPFHTNQGPVPAMSFRNNAAEAAAHVANRGNAGNTAAASLCENSPARAAATPFGDNGGAARLPPFSIQGSQINRFPTGSWWPEG